MPARTTELVINGHSRKSRALHRDILKACAEFGVAIDKQIITNGKDLDKTLDAVIKRAPKLLIVGGGDGTISDVVDHLAGTKIELGIIPLGTTNNFARSLALPRTVREAVKVIASGTTRSVDLGKIKNEYFANVAGIGLSAHIAKAVSDRYNESSAASPMPLSAPCSYSQGNHLR